jgi:hypothetical protein
MGREREVLAVIFVCDCGKRFKAPDTTPSLGNACRHCGGLLRVLGTPGPDPEIVKEQKKALRDELRTRDRQLRIAQNEIVRLQIENDKLRGELQKPRPDVPYVSISEAPVVVDRSADWRPLETARGTPLEMPSERLDLTNVPVLEEIPDLADAPHLPSDRVPLS